MRSSPRFYDVTFSVDLRRSNFNLMSRFPSIPIDMSFFKREHKKPEKQDKKKEIKYKKVPCRDPTGPHVSDARY